MSKKLRMTDEMIAGIKAEFDRALASCKMMDGKFSFTKTFEGGNEKATLVFTAEAYNKMMALVQSFDKEVAWHCVSRRGEKENEYEVYDIVVYPQSVTAATVEMDVAEYDEWIRKHAMAGDEWVFNLKGQGHSHVNMSTSPSGTDMDHQKKVLADMKPDGFYIFVIWNKRNEHTCWVYDLAKNTVFENKDITVQIGGTDLDAFVKEAKDLVVTKAPVTYCGGWNGGYSHLVPASKTVDTKPAKTYATVTPVKQEKEKVKAVIKNTMPGNSCYGYSGDWDEDPSSPFYVRDNYYGME